VSGSQQPSIDNRVGAIRRAFGPAIGRRLSSYSTAELLHDDGTWGPWRDLPIRLEWSSGHLVAASWSRFDDLWISTDLSLPFNTEGLTVRWVCNALEGLNRAVGATLQSVALGRGEMSIAGRDIEVWTRMVLQTDRGWLEVFNALDENGYEFHLTPPPGTFVPCI